MTPIIGGRGAGVRGLGFQGAGAPAQVTGLTATDIGSGRAYNNGRIDLSWSTPSSNGAAITGYKIESSTDGSSYTTLVANTGTTATTYSNTSLLSNQVYYYKVSAINAAGTGIASSVSNATATTVPAKPTAVSVADVGTNRPYGNGAGDVTITVPSNGGKPITLYSAATTFGGFSGTSATNTVRVTGLQKIPYLFNVYATNANGNSETYNSNFTYGPFTTVPQAPTIGTVTRTNNTTVSIPFTAGANGGPAITSYTTTSSPSITLTTTGTTTPLTVTGSFVGGQNYTFTIAAVNANGTSSSSSSSNSVTPRPAPTGYTFSSTAAKWYKLYPDTGSWSTANSTVTADGGWLAVPRNATENTAVKTTANGVVVWLGIGDPTVANRYDIRATSHPNFGTTITYSNWAAAQPTTPSAYLAMQTTGGWSTVTPTSLRRYVGEWY